jgi:hypothetical protein
MQNITMRQREEPHPCRRASAGLDPEGARPLRCREGGVSKWVSSIAIHNELLRRGRKVAFPCCLGL